MKRRDRILRPLEKKLVKANDLMKSQGQDGAWDFSPYMIGVYNGMELILSLIEERRPNFKYYPKKWSA